MLDNQPCIIYNKVRNYVRTVKIYGIITVQQTFIGLSGTIQRD